MQHYGKGVIKGHYALCSCDECHHIRIQRLSERRAQDRRPLPCHCSKRTQQPEVPLAERGQLNGDRAWSLLK